uniref:Uncharacterized protein n=1 Tax=Anguilla anguilla TaxID=7936 RepID=A0A0E9TRK7_ANGAN
MPIAAWSLTPSNSLSIQSSRLHPRRVLCASSFS